MADRRDRGQLSMPIVEAAIGVALILAVATVVGLGGPATEDTRQLDRYAADIMTVLADESPRHGETTRLVEVAASAERFDREAPVLAERIDRLLPDSVVFVVETPHGSVGTAPPATAAAGSETVHTVHGPVTLRVWWP